jgi:hypothetical protein
MLWDPILLVLLDSSSGHLTALPTLTGRLYHDIQCQLLGQSSQEVPHSWTFGRSSDLFHNPLQGNIVSGSPAE